MALREQGVQYWYQISSLRAHPCEITWILDDYVEVFDIETGDYAIVHYSNIEKIEEQLKTEGI